MSILQSIIDVIASYPDIGDADISIDYTSDDGQSNFLAPTGIIVNERTRDIHGNDTIRFQYNCNLFIRRNFLNGLSALDNQTFIENLQFWLIGKNYDESLPQLGSDKFEEYWTAVNGVMIELDSSASSALYTLQLTIDFIKEYTEV